MSVPALETESCAPQGVAAFTDLALPQRLARAVADLGFTTPTPIQAAALPALLSGHDVTGVAQTGTGKTAAFGLPLLAAVDPRLRAVQALVLAPTRELALQVSAAITSFATHLDGVRVVTVYGGSSFGRQVAALKSGAQVVVGTPGRILDHLDRGTLDLGAVRFAVLDEADEMLHMGFVEDVDRILSATPTDRQTALFSATMPAAIRAVARRHQVAPVDVSVAASARPVTQIRQSVAVLPYRHKTEALARILAVSDAEAAVVFVRTRAGCEELGSALLARGVRAAVISGDVSQAERERTIARLRAGQVDVLVATDVAARGLDVERIGLVVNFDAPADAEVYTHRIGRTGRAGRTGESVLLLTPREAGRRRTIERTTGTNLTELEIPTPRDVTRHRAAAMVARAADRLAAAPVDTCRQALLAAAEEHGVSAVDLAAAVLAVGIGDTGATALDPLAVRERTERRERPARAKTAREPRPKAAKEHRGGKNHQGAQGGSSKGNATKGSAATGRPSRGAASRRAGGGASWHRTDRANRTDRTDRAGRSGRAARRTGPRHSS